MRKTNSTQDVANFNDNLFTRHHASPLYPNVMMFLEICVRILPSPSVSASVCCCLRLSSGSGSFFLAAVGAQDVGGIVREEATTDESGLTFRTLETVRMPLSTVECYELRIIDTF